VADAKKVMSQFRGDLTDLLPRLWRFALALCRDAVAAEDLVQETCRRALERQAQFHLGSRLDHWAFAIMVSIRRNDLRRDRVRRGNGLEDAIFLQADEGAGILANILKSQLFAQVAALPEVQREAVMLVYAEGLSYGEAAQILDIPLGTVMSRLAAAKDALAARMNPTDKRMARI
jgi:RNA polymerase sigma-70 factor, ECF subfamily